jgi:hypothetical protein
MVFSSSNLCERIMRCKGVKKVHVETRVTREGVNSELEFKLEKLTLKTAEKSKRGSTLLNWGSLV